MPWWAHTVVGLSIVAAVAAAAWRAAGMIVGRDLVVRGAAAFGLAWLTVQVTGLLTQVPAPGGPELVAGGAALATAAVVLVRIRAPRGDPPAPDRAERAAWAAVAATVLVLAFLVLSDPAFGYDGLGYHLPIPAAWIGAGELGGRPQVTTALPLDAYPVGFEMAVAWLLVVTGSTAAGLLVGPLTAGAFALAVWALTRRLGGSPAAGWGAVASVGLALPVVVQGAQVANDLPATALVACGSLLLVDGSVRVRGARAPNPGGPPGPDARAGASTVLLGAAVVVLAVGVKTTAACGVLLAVFVLWSRRAAVVPVLRSRRIWWPLLAVAAGCGLVWAARNTLVHGSPSWPFAASPFGDAVPPLFRLYTDRFVDHPGAMIEIGGDRYLRGAWTLLLLLPVGVLALARSRDELRLVAITGLLGVAAWTVAPSTGILLLDGAPNADFSVSAVRYLAPCWMLLAAGGWASASRAASGRLVPAAAVAVTVIQLTLVAVGTGEWLFAPFDSDAGGQVLTAALVGAAVVLVVTLGAPRIRVPGGRRGALVVAVVVGAAILVATPGLWDRADEQVRTAVPDRDDPPVASLGRTPAWSVGDHGGPGDVLVADCAALQAARREGRISVTPDGPALGVPACTLPGASSTVDGLRIWPARR